MIRLNILSPESKKNLKLRNLYNSLKTINFIIILVTTTVTLMLLFARIIIRDSFNKVVAETSLITKNSQSYNIKVREINAKINSVEKIQKDFYPWSSLIKTLAAAAPDEVTFSQVNIAQNQKTNTTSLTLEGLAETRDSLLELKERLEKIDYLGKFNLPLSSLVEKQNISFKFSVNLDPEKFK